ncbi:hypothetical protein FRE64_13995 [Euhalothece natronophila Z-M001]|uniref:Uncharacterized protein n=1 Tax=Euhalothece natronophila Z-M001 TaxID=522448 RepID=A0A5B8NNT7_9CHRO|nr:hypothetical protein [Euhalothece natronophila]QDZ40953.1 hypothetical protein FRE64_13995 [Euhalothece natronophila Z-M001]
MKIKKRGKTLITLVSIAGMATASSSGLISQLAQSLDRAMIPKVQAEESTIRNLQRRAVSVEDTLKRYQGVRIAIESGRAMVADERDNYQALRDGVYQHEDLFLIVEQGQLTGYLERGTGKLFDVYEREGNWVEICLGPFCCGSDGCGFNGDDDMPQMSVAEALERSEISMSDKGVFERAQPSQETERPVPGSSL